MKFVDEAKLKVQAGNGGRGCVSFRRENSCPLAPGWRRRRLRGQRLSQSGRGDEHAGGLSDFANLQGSNARAAAATIAPGMAAMTRMSHPHRHRHYRQGYRRDPRGSDHRRQTLLVAKGGKGGWGNTRFKSSTNRTPRKSGLGLPGKNASCSSSEADCGRWAARIAQRGQSTLIRAVSAARPKVADYPFTTLHPNLGVVSVGLGRSFVMADIPGLIEARLMVQDLGFGF